MNSDRMVIREHSKQVVVFFVKENKQDFSFESDKLLLPSVKWGHQLFVFCFSGTKSVLGSYGKTTCSPRCSTFKVKSKVCEV